MTRSLSVLLPVHNVQATLQADVGQMLDLLPDLAHDFDVLIIDDGSTDATCEVAEELATQFPQVKYVRHSRRRGVAAALGDGLTRTNSHIVLGHNGQSRIDTAEIVRLWHRERQPFSPLMAGGAGSFHLLRRDAGEAIGAFRSVKRIERQHIARPSGQQQPAASRRANFLRRLKDFALGE